MPRRASSVLSRSNAGRAAALPGAVDSSTVRERTNAAADRTLIPQAESSWYLGANIPGKPRAVLPYAGGFAAYARICDDVALRGYPGFAMT